MRRRSFLLGAAGAGVAAAAGASAFAVTRTPVAALTPWDEAGRETDPRRFVIGHAVLAPNPHNRQPWLFELAGADAIVLRCDLDRRLPETDPFDRQITVGLGAAIELASLAAGRIGRELVVNPFPEGEPSPRLDGRPVARLTLMKREGVAVDPLFAHVVARRSTKRPFDLARAVPTEALATLAATATDGATIAAVTEPARVERLRDLTWAAWEVEARTARTHMESVRLMRIGRAEIEANPDGISLGGPMLETLAALGSLNRETLADPSSSAFAQGHAMYRAMLAATPAYLTVTTPDEGRAGQIAAGRAYLRANLAATALGLCLHPVSQSQQEFPEMAELKTAVEGVCGIGAPARLHMLVRLGYGPAMPRSPRWGAETRIRTA